MKGKGEIEAIEGVGIRVKSSLYRANLLDLLGMCEALIQGFNLDTDTRQKLGMMIAAGGPSVIPGVDMTVVRPTEELLRRMRGKPDD